MSPAARMRRSRARRREGRRVLQIEVADDSVDWILEWLGVIPPSDDEAEKEQTAAAIGRLLDSFPRLVARNAARR